MTKCLGSEYAIIYPYKLSLSRLVKVLAKTEDLDCNDFCEWTEKLGKKPFSDDWRILMSLIAMRLVFCLTRTLKLVGVAIEFFLNLVNLNGGPVVSILRFSTGNLQIPRMGSEDFLSINGLLERRTDLGGHVEERPLVNGETLDHHSSLPSCLGDKFYFDLCAMSSALAYENRTVIRKRVTDDWKMHFVKFYDLWNDGLRKNATQAFISCDRELDANIVLLTFRGTEPFNADHWQTQSDMSWFRIPFVGKVHLGFMEALGLANRYEQDMMKNLTTGSSRRITTSTENNKPLAYYTLVSELNLLLSSHMNAKLLVTGHGVGGALAVLFVAVMVLKSEDELLRRLLGIYTFGQPKVGDEEFGKYFEKKLKNPVPRYYRVVYNNDIVPHFPFDDNKSLFKHFGSCLYYNHLYQLEDLPESSKKNLKNLSVSYIIANMITALRDALACLFMPCYRGSEFRETWICTISRFTVGILCPGLLSHSMVNYVHSARLSPASVKCS